MHFSVSPSPLDLVLDIGDLTIYSDLKGGRGVLHHHAHPVPVLEGEGQQRGLAVLHLHVSPPDPHTLCKAVILPHVSSL